MPLAQTAVRIVKRCARFFVFCTRADGLRLTCLERSRFVQLERAIDIATSIPTYVRLFYFGLIVRDPCAIKLTGCRRSCALYTFKNKLLLLLEAFDARVNTNPAVRASPFAAAAYGHHHRTTAAASMEPLQQNVSQRCYYAIICRKRR